jgi:uncharacterized protein (DUF362 family)
VIRVGLARARPDYAGLAAPFGPDKAYPELGALLGGGDAGCSGPNHVYAAVRAALAGVGLDAARFGSADWNPLGELVARGGSVVLKPNFIRHWNPNPAGSVESLVTHGSLLRAVADYAFLAVGPGGSVTIAEAPQHDCDWERIRSLAGLDALERFYGSRLGVELGVVDLRREAVAYRDGTVVERRALPGDPLGYRLLDLGARSHFSGSGLDPRRFRGADYDPVPTEQHHSGGHNAYLLSRTVLGADLVVNLPKLKTHKKTGVTLALKNLVGMCGDKNLLPHHCAGPPSAGGDEFPGEGWLDRGRSLAADRARRWLARGRAIGLVRAARRIEGALRGDAFVRAGNWHGNRTTWRMCLDLNRCLYYSDAGGERLDAPAPVRRVLTLLDGVVAGEGEGPLAPRDRPLGAVLASLDPIALDLLALRLMGFDEQRIPKVREAMRDRELRFTAVSSPEDVEVAEVAEDGRTLRSAGLEEYRAREPFLAHPGWRGQVEQPRHPEAREAGG